MSTARPPIALLSVAANLERHKLASGEPWLLLLDMQYPGAADPTAPQQHVRLARNTDDLTYDAGDGNGPQVYQAFNFKIGDFAVSTTGSVPETKLEASNVLRVLQTTIEQYGGCVGASLSLYVLLAANLAGEPELAMNFTVKDTVCDLKLVTFKLGASSPLRRLFPLFMYRPNFCAWTFNSPALQAAQAAATAAGNTAYLNPGRFCGYQGVTVTASAVQNQPGLTLASTAGLVSGMVVTGPGLPAGTEISSVVSATDVTTSNFATANVTDGSYFAVLTTCSHTLDGTTGCRAHFPNAPMRALCFPGIDSAGAAAASVV